MRLLIRFPFASGILCCLASILLTAGPARATEDFPPVVTAPATFSGTEFIPLSFTVTASDANEGHIIETLTASPLPAGATFTTSADQTSGTFAWTPADGQAGTYSITFTATNHTGPLLRSGSATTTITVAPGDHAPVVSAPLGVNGEEEGVIAFGVSASDPDGNAISTLTADFSALPPGNDATFTPSGDNTTGTFLWHMQLGDEGTYAVEFTATANGLSGSATTILSVGPAGVGATGLFTWTPQPGEEGVYAVVFTATDAGGTTTFTSTITVVSPSLSSAPSASLSQRTPVSLSPQAPQKGPIVSGTGSTTTTTGTSTTLSVYATTSPETSASPSAPLRAGSVSLAPRAVQLIALSADLTDLPPDNDAAFTVDHEPIVNGLSAVTVDAGTTLTLVRGADDPDGDAIASFTADLTALPPGNDAAFSVNGSNTIGTLTWTTGLGDAGTYLVDFTATNRLVGHGSTLITVRAAASARVFMSGPQKIRLGSNRPQACLQVEPVGGSFDLLDVDVSTIRMVSPGTGTVSEIPALTAKTVVIGDRDNNLVEDMTVCFAKADLRQLFSLLNGKNTVTVTIQGQLSGGAFFAGTLAIEVIATGGPALAEASVSPNPLNPQAKLRFSIAKAGLLRVSLYDAQGRLVRRLADEAHAAPGLREITIDGRDSRGSGLASGVYYFRIEAAEGVTNGRIAIVR